MSSTEPSKTDKVYGAYKVSEYTHEKGGKSYKVDESEGVPAR